MAAVQGAYHGLIGDEVVKVGGGYKLVLCPDHNFASLLIDWLTASFICSFLQWLFIESVLYSRYFPQHWEYRNEQKKGQGLSSQFV